MQSESGEVSTQLVGHLCVDDRGTDPSGARLGSPVGGSGQPLPLRNCATTVDSSAEIVAGICRSGPIVASCGSHRAEGHRLAIGNKDSTASCSRATTTSLQEEEE